MRTETVSRTIYTFEELSDAAKEKARDWYREGALDYEWWDSVYEDAGRIFAILGIDSSRVVSLGGGRTRVTSPDIEFSGFWSQGDGASFAGTYRYKRGSARAIARYAPQDEELQRIGRELMQLQKRHGYSLACDIIKSGRYSHEYTMDIEGMDCGSETKSAMLELFRDLARWIYRTLEAEYEYLNSDESVDEMIVANEYEFTEDGERA